MATARFTPCSCPSRLSRSFMHREGRSVVKPSLHIYQHIPKYATHPSLCLHLSNWYAPLGVGAQVSSVDTHKIFAEHLKSQQELSQVKHIDKGEYVVTAGKWRPTSAAARNGGPWPGSAKWITATASSTAGVFSPSQLGASTDAAFSIIQGPATSLLSAFA